MVIFLFHHHQRELDQSVIQVCVLVFTHKTCLCPFDMSYVSLPVPSQNSPSRDQLIDHQQRRRTDVAKVTFDLYKNNPKDFIGCLNVKATLYGAYSVSYDLRCYAAKKMLK